MAKKIIYFINPHKRIGLNTPIVLHELGGKVTEYVELRYELSTKYLELLAAEHFTWNDSQTKIAYCVGLLIQNEKRKCVFKTKAS